MCLGKHLSKLLRKDNYGQQQKGYSRGTNDWEFFALEADKNGTKIVTSGAKRSNNFFGLNFFECHKAARAQCDSLQATVGAVKLYVAVPA
jgi:hypothetical protein